jgi:hypothetical protein
VACETAICYYLVANCINLKVEKVKLMNQTLLSLPVPQKLPYLVNYLSAAIPYVKEVLNGR